MKSNEILDSKIKLIIPFNFVTCFLAIFTFGVFISILESNFLCKLLVTDITNCAKSKNACQNVPLFSLTGNLSNAVISVNTSNSVLDPVLAFTGGGAASGAAAGCCVAGCVGCVGTATEKRAKSVGFQNIFAAEGNVNNLKELILQNFNPPEGKLLYVSGEVIFTNLDEQLLSEGYNIERVINYRTNPIEKYDEMLIEKLKLKMPEIVYVYSQNSAINFLKVIKDYRLEVLWMNTNLMCISEKTSSILNEIKWKKIFIFNPGEEEFLLYKI